MDVLAVNFMNTFELSGNTMNKYLYDHINNNLLSKENIEKISAGDNEHLAGNKDILTLVGYCIGGFTLFIILFVGVSYAFINGYLPENHKLKDIREVLGESLIILLFIGLTEFIFIKFFGSTFISINVNNIKYNIIKSLLSYKETVTGKITEKINEHV